MNVQLLRIKMAENNIKQFDLADILKTSDSNLSNKLKGRTRFNLEEVSTMKKHLKLTNKEIVDIFLD